MEFFIQQWPDQFATLMLADGTSVNTYHSVNEAQAVHREWCKNHAFDKNHEQTPIIAYIHN